VALTLILAAVFIAIVYAVGKNLLGDNSQHIVLGFLYIIVCVLITLVSVNFGLSEGRSWKQFDLHPGSSILRLATTTVLCIGRSRLRC
jgi:hypothetical protein